MYQDYPYLPGEARQNGDWCRPLPPLPNKPFLSAIMQYRPDLTFELFLRIDKSENMYKKSKLLLWSRPMLDTANFLRLSRLVCPGS